MAEHIGKKVADRSYFHVSLLPQLSNQIQQAYSQAFDLVSSCHPETLEFNVVKVSEDINNLSLLNYPEFFSQAFPELGAYWTVNLAHKLVRHRTYANSINPPVLHRKELLISRDDPRYSEFQELTLSAEQVGLFADPNRIGFKQAWEALLSQRGYKVIGHRLIPIGNDEATYRESPTLEFSGVERHLTALTRYNLSAPLQTLSRFGLLDGSRTIFDYGCGRGDDLRELRESNLVADGWDPHYAPDNPKKSADLVNLGFVINVIEDFDERTEALKGAYELANQLLIVSAMLANEEQLKGKPYGDGVLTSRNTFQKYYTQQELGHFIGEVLNEQPTPIAPGIFYVFKDKDFEQRFMLNRVENRRTAARLRYFSRPESHTKDQRTNLKYEQHKDLLESLWETYLMFGRRPEKSEIPDLEKIIQSFGTVPAALRFISSRKENSKWLIEAAHQARLDDLSVYFAQLQFQKRKPYKHLDSRLQKDIRYFFGDYKSAAIQGRDLLLKAGIIEEIYNACKEAAEDGIGWLDEEKSLQLHTSLVEQLPPVLRTYVYCGTALYGDLSSADLIKIHIRSGKLTLMKFDDFENKPFPRMLQRIKLNLRRQDFELYDYAPPYSPPYLYQKSRFINEEYPRYSEQIEIEAKLEGLGLFDFSEYGPAPELFEATLQEHRYMIDGFKLVRSPHIPALDDPCGKYLTYRQFIECGETQSRIQIANLPKQPESYTALYELATRLLDLIIEYFGMVDLTYGFCSHELAAHINGRIAPKLDQHAAHEINRVGNPICERLGAAVDFMVADENMIEVAQWIANNLEFDRMYVYGSDRPIHLSLGPEMKQQITAMVFNAGTQTRMPKVIKPDLLKDDLWV